VKCSCVLTGAFGKIYRGVLVGETESDPQSEQTVYVKTVTGEWGHLWRGEGGET